MFMKKITLFRVFGFRISLDVSWILLAVLITWSFAAGIFPAQYPGFAAGTYWLMGIFGALGLFVCILLHEMGHAIVARQYGIPIKDITLFIFGGVAEMEDEPPDAGSEFLMAIAGPATSVVLAAVLFLAYQAGMFLQLGLEPGLIVVGYLAWLNLVLAAFNMLPAFPLDGGRVLRAGLWAWRKNLRWATSIAAGFGSAFGIALVVLGVLALLSGNIIGGLWWFMIGMFMRAASQMSYKQVLVRRALEGESLRRFMRLDPITVSPDMTVEEVVEHFVYRYHHKMFPVVDGEGRLLGCISTKEIKDVPREDWGLRRVGHAMCHCACANEVSPDEDPMKVLALMNRTGLSRLLVVEEGKLTGIVALKDLLRFLSLKIDLEESDDTTETKVVPVWNLGRESRRGPLEEEAEEVETWGPPPRPRV